MLNITALVQLKAFARQDGAWLALLWATSFLLTIYMPSSSWGSAMAVSTPFFVGWRLNSFRNYALDGIISFRRGLVFSIYTFFYATLLFAVLQYVYFRYFDHGAMMNMLLHNVNIIEEAYKNADANLRQTVDDLKRGTELIGELTPIELAFIFMMQNLFIGVILSLPIAFFCKKSRANYSTR